MDCTGGIIMECILETKAVTILEFFAGLRGSLAVTFEEGTCAAWLYDLLKPHVVLVCNPRKNALLKAGNKSDRIDARKLAELLRGNQLNPVYHGETGVRMLRELSRSYLTIVKDLSRVMNRLKALYRSWAMHYNRHRAEWLEKIREPGVRRRAERLYQQLDMLAATGLIVIASMRSPRSYDRFLTWADSIGFGGGADSERHRSPYNMSHSGLALETRVSAEYSYATGNCGAQRKLSPFEA